MVDNQVRHQVEIRADAQDIVPVTDTGFYLLVITHGKTVIAGVGKERQDMHTVDEHGEVRLQEVMQCLEWVLVLAQDRVGIGDDEDISLIPQIFVR